MLYSKGETKAKSRGEKVIFIGDLKCKVSLTPRTMTIVEGDMTLQTNRNSKLIERNETSLYRMRRNYARGLAHLSDLPPEKLSVHRHSNLSEDPKSDNHKPPLPPKLDESGPFLGIGNWGKSPQHTDLARSQSQPNIVKPEAASTIHTLPHKLRASPKALEAIPVKSFELLTAERKQTELNEIWARSEFYQSYIALLSKPKLVSIEEPKLKTSSFEMQLRSIGESSIKRTRLCTAKAEKESRDAGIQMKSSGDLREPVVQKVAAQVMNISLQHELQALTPQDKGLKPRAMPAKLAASRSSRLKSSSNPRRNSLASFPDCASLPYAVVCLPIAAPQLLHMKKSRTVDILPKDIPPHRIPVEYGMFRKVCKSRR